MIKVAAITSGLDTPSTRFRIRQHITALAMHGVQINEFIPKIDKNFLPKKFFGKSPLEYPVEYAYWQAKKLLSRVPSVMSSYKHDITLISREILPGYPSIEKLYSGPIVTDVDDAIWLSRPFGVRASINLAKNSEKVIVGNDYLANWFSQYNKNIEIVPTAVSVPIDCQYSAINNNTDIITVGWIGTKGNIQYLDAIKPALKRIIGLYKGYVRIAVVSDGFFNLDDNNDVVNIKWSPDVEDEFLRRIDIGIMPLADDDWCKGKCSFKLLQYMSNKKPSVVSPVGMNRKVITESKSGFCASEIDEWVSHLSLLIEDEMLRRSLGELGLVHVKEHYSTSVISGMLAKIFSRI